jgi:hypothetical protein
MGTKQLLYFFKSVVATLVSAMLFVSGSGIALAAIASPASDTLTRLQANTAVDHEIVFASPTGIDSATDTITFGFTAFSLGLVDAGDVSVSWGPVTGFENTTSVAVVPGVGVWGASFGGGVLTLSAPTDSALNGILPGSLIGVRIGLNAGGSHQITNPAAATIALIPIAGSFGDSNTIAVPIMTNDGVTVSATVPSATSSPPCIGCGGGGGGGGGAQPPVISNIQVTAITTSTAIVTWDTDQLTNSTLSFGHTISYASGTLTNGAQVMSHSMTLTGLIPDQQYHFQVSSVNGLTLLGATSADGTFTTLAENIPLIITNLQVVNITDSTAMVIWNTNKPASSVVDFGLTNGYGQVGNVAGLVTSHAVPLSGLLSSTLYHYRVTSVDASNEMAQSLDGTFTTLADITPPANVINLSVTPGDTVNVLNWTLPPDPDFVGTKIVRKLGSHPTNPFDGVMVYDGNAVTTVDTSLTNGVMYYYAAYAYDAHGNFASGALGQGMPNGVIVVPPTSTPPVPPATSTPPVIPPTTTSTVSTTTVPVTPPTSVQTITATYYAKGGTIPLSPDTSGVVGVLAGAPVRVVLPTTGLSSIPTQVTVTVGGNVYNMSYVTSESVFAAAFVVPMPGDVSSRVTAIFADGSQAQVLHTLRAQSSGLVTESSLFNTTENPVSGADVVLYREVGGVWSKSPSAMGSRSQRRATRAAVWSNPGAKRASRPAARYFAPAIPSATAR